MSLREMLENELVCGLLGVFETDSSNPLIPSLKPKMSGQIELLCLQQFPPSVTPILILRSQASQHPY
jgi:hypothetical protein